jgi:hypothetical protein
MVVVRENLSSPTFPRSSGICDDRTVFTGELTGGVTRGGGGEGEGGAERCTILNIRILAYVCISWLREEF